MNLSDEQLKRVTELLGTSADDCGISIMNDVEINPYQGLRTVADALAHLNRTLREKKAHRQALMKAGRKALKDLGEL